MQKLQNIVRAMISVTLLASVEDDRAQIVVESLSRNGELMVTNLEPGTTATVEWAASLEGPWSDNWAGLRAAPADSNGTLTASVPMFYRVRGVPVNPNPEGLVWIPPGTFLMGSPVSEPEREALFQLYGLGNETLHEVALTQGYWMAKHETTQEQFSAIMGSNPSYFSGVNLPVENVTWYESVAYCEALTAREQAAGRLPEGYVYRLPTEAEWEYACRAGSTTAFYLGDELRSGQANFDGTREYSVAEGGTVANPAGTAYGRTRPVGDTLFQPNAWGLYDMHGNVKERCADRIENYPAGPVTDPSTPRPTADWGPVERGGNWRGPAANCRSAARDVHFPDFRHNGYGFRVVLARPLQ